MITKQRLIRRLENLAALEDEGVSLISRSLRRLVERSDLPADKKARILEIVDTIKRESEGHREAILQRVEKIKRGERHEF